MNALTFIVELVKALAWPTTIMILAWLLRKPIRELIPLLTRLKYKDLELEFGRRMSEVKADASEELPPPEPVAAAGTAELRKLIEQAMRSPRAAIAEAWTQVEIAALLAAHRNNLFSPTDVTTTTRVIRALERRGVIDAGKIGLLHDLRALRDQAVHSPDFGVSTENALDYVQLARRLREYLETARGSDTSEK